MNECEPRDRVNRAVLYFLKMKKDAPIGKWRILEGCIMTSDVETVWFTLDLSTY